MNSQTMTAGVFETSSDDARNYRAWVIAAGIASLALGTAAVIYNGSFRTIGSVILQFPSWGWSVASGLISVALGVMLAMQWPASGEWFIGFAVGLDLILYGWALLMFAAAIKNLWSSRV